MPATPGFITVLGLPLHPLIVWVGHAGAEPAWHGVR